MAAALFPLASRVSTVRSSSRSDFADANLSNSEFHLHPHYRMPCAIDALLLKTRSGSDEFVTEKYADEIAEILAQWSTALLRSPQDSGPIEKVFLSAFSGVSLLPVETRIVRPGPAIEVRLSTFAPTLTPESALGRNAFVQELRSALSRFSMILTAEFQVTSIKTAPGEPSKLETRIRYELVGEGARLLSRAAHRLLGDRLGA